MGRPCLHSMHVIPSTLHKKTNFIYNDVMYSLHEDTKWNRYLNFEEQQDHDDPPISVLLEDDWGSLDFTPNLESIELLIFYLWNLK